ncbi:MAG TPA: hypothetical protein VJ911_03320, partial [Cryomorphaceae bacterium]|nr:hypothetical protein [Cryomorphaceae bacterium]
YIVSCTGKESDEGPSGSNSSSFDCPENGSPVFMEDSGLVKVDVASIDASETDWSLRTDIDDYSGGGFLVWEGENAMGAPGNGRLTFNVHISTPGTYRFLWRSYITIGDNHTEHNDSWLRIPDAAHFYGKKNNGHIVYPKGSNLPPIPESSEQSNTEPNGAGSDGWFKVYMNTANNWKWQASTSDHDAHNIYAVFTHPGIYTIEISGRSTGHGVDTFVLYNPDVYNQGEATEVAMSGIACQ